MSSATGGIELAFFGIIIVVVVLVIGGVAYFQYKRRQERITALAALARSVGFTFSVDDTQGIVTMPFELFGRGRGRSVELVMSGTHNDVPLDLFDYWYYDETRDSNGNTSRTYHRFTCGLAKVPLASPHVRIAHENFLTRIGEHIGVHDIEFESDEFNRRFRVKCDDQKFAFCLIDGRMMTWLEGADSFQVVELVGPYVLLASSKVAPSQWLALGTWLEQFKAHMPPVVFTTYPAS